MPPNPLKKKFFVCVSFNRRYMDVSIDMALYTLDRKVALALKYCIWTNVSIHILDQWQGREYIICLCNV